MTARCSSCDAHLTPGATSCTWCGAELGSAPPPAPQQAAPFAPAPVSGLFSAEGAAIEAGAPVEVPGAAPSPSAPSAGAAPSPGAAVAWPPAGSEPAAWTPAVPEAATWPPAAPPPAATWPPAAASPPAEAWPPAASAPPQAPHDPRFGPPAEEELVLELDWSNRQRPAEASAISTSAPLPPAPIARGSVYPVYGQVPLSEAPGSARDIAEVMGPLDVPEWKQEAIVFAAELIGLVYLIAAAGFAVPMNPLGLAIAVIGLGTGLFAGSRLYAWGVQQGCLGWAVMFFTLGILTCLVGAAFGYANRFLFQLVPKAFRPGPLIIGGAGATLLLVVSQIVSGSSL